MLNYIWLALIVIGVLVAIGNDWHDLSVDKYHNGEKDVVIISGLPTTSLETGKSYSCSVRYVRGLVELHDQQRNIYRDEVARETGINPQRGELIPRNSTSAVLHLFIQNDAPVIWLERFAGQKKNDYLLAQVTWDSIKSGTIPYARLEYDPIKFVKLNAVTNDGILKSAKTAVELAIGLIGLMALWLGIMKIAEQSGLIAKLASFLKPITTRLFPDVPADHPAMGAMIMNISANMLGLANAATPLGLKAMEELNKLNKKVGTATDAMCTFLVINTSNVQLIPATVIAIRASAGSVNPTEIIGPVIVATFIALVVGVTTAKLLARMPIFKKQLLAAE
jgi:spore maturation protein A